MKHLSEQWRQRLIAAGFSEATDVPDRFFKPDTSLTAFFVNLQNSDGHTLIYYGYASTAFTRLKGCEDTLLRRGISETGTCLRYAVSISSPEDAPLAEREIRAVFARFRGTEKDALLAQIKEKRKAFLNRIHLILQPLGFRRKADAWSKDLSADHTVHFRADKSPYSDTYNFPVTISARNKKLPSRYYCTINTLQPPDSRAFSCRHSSHRFDWQLHSHEDLLELIHDFLRMYVTPAEMGMDHLGKEEHIRGGCFCPRDCCAQCWIPGSPQGHPKE